jgi:hypothetical protein
VRAKIVAAERLTQRREDLTSLRGKRMSKESGKSLKENGPNVITDLKVRRQLAVSAPLK